MLLLAALPLVGQTQPYSHGDPTPEEQLMLEYINRARANPTEEGIRLMDTPDGAVQSAYSYFGIDKQKTKQAFTTYPQRPPLAFHPALIEASRNHSQDMDEKNFQGHTSSNGDQVGQRYAKVGYSSMGMYGENVAAYTESVWHGHCGLNVDWGEENQRVLGHRSNIMNFGNGVYTEIGVGILFNGKGLMQGHVGPYVVTQNFGTRTQKYILGVVYIDKNNNGFYDIGEGVAGVKVTPSRGSYHAVSSTSGGYAIPYSGNGSVTIVANGGGLPAEIRKTVELVGDNVKVDFVPASAGPGSLTLSKPTNNATNVSTTVTLEWGVAPQADKYIYQVSKDQQFTASGIIASGETTTRSAVVAMPACNTRYYWRVQGMNDVGKGAWSSTFSFTTGGKMPTSSAGTLPKGATLAGSNDFVTFTWSAANEATSYHFRVKLADPPFSVIVEDSLVTTNNKNVRASDLGSGNFTWEVRPKNACGMSGWSTPLAFSLSVTSVHDVTDGSLALEVRPQPVVDAATVMISSIADDVIDLRIQSISGQIVFSGLFPVTSGESALRIPAMQQLPPGMYVVFASTSAGASISVPMLKL